MDWIYPAQPSFTRVMTKINNNQQFVGFLGIDRPVSKIEISKKATICAPSRHCSSLRSLPFTPLHHQLVSDSHKSKTMHVRSNNNDDVMLILVRDDTIPAHGTSGSYHPP